jgi:integrase
MKMRVEHQVPLSRQALAIIRSMDEVSDRSEWVFPSWTRKKPLSETAVNGALKRLGYAGRMTAHGFRSTASSLLNESHLWSPDAIERSLAHQDANAIRKVYNRTQYWDERVAMM